MASWHSQEEAGRLREVNRAAKALLASQKAKEREDTWWRRGAGERVREGTCRRDASSNNE